GHRRLAPRARDVSQGGGGLEQARGAGVAAVGAGLAESGDTQDHELGLQLPERVLVEVPALERAGTVVLDQHVEARQESFEQCLARAFVAVHCFPKERLAVLVRWQRAQWITTAREFNFQHLGAEIAEQGGCEGPSNYVGYVEDLEALEGATHAKPSPRALRPASSVSENPQSSSACLPPAPRSGAAP